MGCGRIDYKYQMTYEELMEENKALKIKVRTLTEMVESLSKDIQKNGVKICPRCGGVGTMSTYWDWNHICPKCHGKGVIDVNGVR